MLGARIAALRKEKGLSQAELARRLKVSPSAIGMYEQGRREPSGQTLVAMAELFGVSTDYLLTGQARTRAEADTLAQMLLSRIASAGHHLQDRPGCSLTRQELAVLIAAMLMD